MYTYLVRDRGTLYRHKKKSFSLSAAFLFLMFSLVPKEQSLNKYPMLVYLLRFPIEQFIDLGDLISL